MSAREVDRLLADLQSADAVRREAAVARLRVLGTRAVQRLAAFVHGNAEPAARALALGVFEGLEDPRAADAAREALASSDSRILVAALGVLRGWVGRETGTRLLEVVTTIAIDRARDARVRVAAMDALADLPDHLTRPIREQTPPPESGGPPPDDPAGAAEWIGTYGHAVTLSRLQEMVTTFRGREEAESSEHQREQWRRARAVTHRVLAERGSRLALYDAREAFAAAQAPLPQGFVDALVLIGDASCLEPLARAWASASADSQWRTQLAHTARQIRLQSRLGSRSAVLRGLRTNWPGFL